MSESPARSMAEKMVGRTLDARYRLLEVLGEGGMGAVFVAEHLTLHKQVALKIVRPEHAGNVALAARFAREAMVTSRIDHPNVISAIDYGTLDDGSAYLAMQLVRGKALNEILADEGALPWPRVAELGAQMADALAEAKKHAIVHRDLKPENVLMQQRDDGTEQIKVLDFGIAKFTRESLAPPPLRGNQSVTAVGVVIGTPGYMAPEQAIGQRSDYRADLYSMGVILWECLMGRRLWDGGSMQSMIRDQLNGNPPPIKEASGDPSIPEPFEVLLSQLLANAPHDRPTNIGAVRDLLREIASFGREGMPREGFHPSETLRPPLASERPPPGAKGHAEPTPTPTPLTGSRPSRPPTRSEVSVAGGVAIAIVLIVGGLLYTGQLEVRPSGGLAETTAEVGAAAEPLPDTKGLPGAQARGAPAAPLAPTMGATGLPRELEPRLGAMAHSDLRSQRVAAAAALLGHIPGSEVPKYVRGLAHMQLAETCSDKRVQLLKVEALADPRALPLLVTASQRGKAGCGADGNRDCLACMRADLDRIIAGLEALPR